MSEWQLIDSAPLGQMVLLWSPVWRHTFPGQRVGSYGEVYVDTCEAEARGRRGHATHWMPLPLPPADSPI